MTLKEELLWAALLQMLVNKIGRIKNEKRHLNCCLMSEEQNMTEIFLDAEVKLGEVLTEIADPTVSRQGRRQLPPGITHKQSQRAVIAARVANMPAYRPTNKSADLRTNISQPEAARLFNVSERMIQTVKEMTEPEKPKPEKTEVKDRHRDT